MTKINRTILFALICMLHAVNANAQAGPNGKYASVNGLKMYYEVHGSGQPLILIHGAFSAIGTSFGQILPDLAKTRQVIGIELQGHGRTADVDRPLTMQGMAADVAALIEHLKLKNVDVYGYS